MTNEQNALICTKLCGYEVQVSPAGKHYIVTDEGTLAMPDFETDWHEAMTTLIEVCRSRKWYWSLGVDENGFGYVRVSSVLIYDPRHLWSIAHCLLQIAEGEE